MALNWQKRLKAYFMLPDITRLGSQQYRQAWYKRMAFPGRAVRSQLQQKYQKFINNSLGYDNRANYTDSASRRRRYRQYALMQYTPELSTALDIYADQVTVQNQTGQMFQINCDDPKIVRQLNKLFFDVLDLNLNLWQWVRMRVRNGDQFIGLIIDQKLGIIDHRVLDAQDVSVVQQQDQNFPGTYKLKYKVQGRNIQLQQYQVAHFRILNETRYLPYGKGILQAARRVWRQLTLAQDRMLIYRMVRAPQRRVFNIQVGNIEPKDVQNYMNQVKSKLKSQFVIQQNVGDVVLRYKPTSVQQDYFIPKRGDKKSQIMNLPGGVNATAIEDIQYLQQKLFATIKVPKAYLNYTRDLTARATAAVQDVRFAKTVQRIQKSMRSTLQHIAWVHLLAKYDKPKQDVKIKIKFFPSSTVLQQSRLGLTQKRFQVFNAAIQTGAVSKYWGRIHILGFDQQQMVEIQKQQLNQAKFNMALKAMGSKAGGEETGFGGGGLGDLGRQMPGGEQLGRGMPGGTQQTLPPVPQKTPQNQVPGVQAGPLPGRGEGGQR